MFMIFGFKWYVYLWNLRINQISTFADTKLSVKPCNAEIGDVVYYILEHDLSL